MLKRGDFVVLNNYSVHSAAVGVLYTKLFMFLECPIHIKDPS